MSRPRILVLRAPGANCDEETQYAFERAGGKVVSTGGRPLAPPAGNSTLRVAIVRDPNNLFVVLIEAPTAG